MADTTSFLSHLGPCCTPLGLTPHPTPERRAGQGPPSKAGTGSAGISRTWRAKLSAWIRPRAWVLSAPGSPSRAPSPTGKVVADPGVGLAQGQELHPFGGDVGAAAAAAGPRLRGDDDVDPRGRGSPPEATSASAPLTEYPRADDPSRAAGADSGRAAREPGAGRRAGRRRPGCARPARGRSRAR